MLSTSTRVIPIAIVRSKLRPTTRQHLLLLYTTRRDASSYADFTQLHITTDAEQPLQTLLHAPAKGQWNDEK
jgi:hypothetical protein